MTSRMSRRACLLVPGPGEPETMRLLVHALIAFDYKVVSPGNDDVTVNTQHREERLTSRQLAVHGIPGRGRLNALPDESPEEHATGVGLVVVGSRSTELELAHSREPRSHSSCRYNNRPRGRAFSGLLRVLTMASGAWLDVVDNEARCSQG